MKPKIDMKKHITRPKKKSLVRALPFQFIRALFFTAMFCFLVFILGNIVASQLISPLYTQTIEEDKKATVTFLQSIRTLPEFSQILQANSLALHEDLYDEVFSEHTGRSELIRKLNEYLRYNPKSRDALYSLSLLYRQEGDYDKADNYFRQAHEIDPTLQKDR